MPSYSCFAAERHSGQNAVERAFRRFVATRATQRLSRPAGDLALAMGCPGRPGFSGVVSRVAELWLFCRRWAWRQNAVKRAFRRCVAARVARSPRPVAPRPWAPLPGLTGAPLPGLTMPGLMAFGYVAAVVRVRSCPHPSRCCAARPREAPRSDWQTRGELGCAASWAAPCPPGCARADCAPHRRMRVAGAPPGQRWSRHRNVSVVVNTVFYHCRTSSRRPWTSVPNNGSRGTGYSVVLRA